MSENLAEQLQRVRAEREARQQADDEAQAARRAGALAARESLVAAYAAEQLPEFIEALKAKLQVAAENNKDSASIRWTTGDSTRAAGARRALEQTATHFEEEGLETTIQSYDDGHMGAANGELEVRSYVPPTNWTTVLTASIPPTGS